MTEFTSPAPEIPRDRWNRPLVVPPGGGKPVAYTRCTTFVDCLDDKFNLQAWQQRMVATGLAARGDLLLRASSLGREPSKLDEVEHKRWKKDMDGVCNDAREAAAASAAATTGTALHALTERLDRGQDVGVVPPAYLGHLKAYEKATSTFESVHIETFTVLDNLRIGGTPDRVVRVDGLPGTYIADVKTGSMYGAAKMAMQLAVYAHSQLYTNGVRSSLGDVSTERGLIIALDATTGHCGIHWIDLTDAWAAVDLAHQVRQWRAKKPTSFLSEYTTAEHPVAGTELDAATGAALDHAIKSAPTVDVLVSLWAEASARNQWGETHTAAAAERRQQLTQTTAQATA